MANKTEVYDPFADPFNEPIVSMDVGEGEEPSGPAGDGPYYRWKGRRYPRVTHIISTGASNEGLFSYFGASAAKRAAAHLVHAGLYRPDLQTESGVELEEFVDSEAIRRPSGAEAIALACDWKFNMREGFRYRDHKSRIGRVMHHAMYESAIGLWKPGANEDLRYLEALAARQSMWSPDEIQRLDDLGVTRESAVRDLALHALPYVRHAVEWTDQFRPEFEAIGLEACVISTQHEYAGTLDGIATFSRSTWEKAGRAWPFGQSDTARVLLDFKSSNTLSDMVKFQLAAYARADFIATFADEGEHNIPEVDGIMAVHVKPDSPVSVRHWVGREVIDEIFEGFQFLNGWYRAKNRMPRAKASRRYVPPKPVVGARECPIKIGGAR